MQGSLSLVGKFQEVNIIAKVENKLKFFINNNKELSEGDIIID